MKYVRTKPINGAARPILIQIARGDRTTVNPVVADAIYAGMLADRVTLYRHDLFDQHDLHDPRTGQPVKFPEPHTFLVGALFVNDPNPVKAIARRAQEQIAEFYNSNGENMVDPDVLCDRIPGCGGADVAAPLFETPAATVPTDFGFVFP